MTGGDALNLSPEAAHVPAPAFRGAASVGGRVGLLGL